MRTYRSDVRIRRSGSDSAGCFDIVPAVGVEPSSTSIVAITRTARNHLLLATFVKIQLITYSTISSMQITLKWQVSCSFYKTAIPQVQRPRMPSRNRNFPGFQWPEDIHPPGNQPAHQRTSVNCPTSDIQRNYLWRRLPVVQNRSIVQFRSGHLNRRPQRHFDFFECLNFFGKFRFNCRIFLLN